jgi:hypothetical protein
MTDKRRGKMSTFINVENSEEYKLAVGCAAFEAQFWLSLNYEARASSSGYEVEAQLKLRLKLVSLK